jgi:hypothetical protein
MKTTRPEQVNLYGSSGICLDDYLLAMSSLPSCCQARGSCETKSMLSHRCLAIAAWNGVACVGDRAIFKARDRTPIGANMHFLEQVALAQLVVLFPL